MKILHCADLHMDSPMETHMTREQAAKRNAEILMSFQRMTEYAEKEKVRVVLIAGDLFDGERVTRRTVEVCWMRCAVHRRSTIYTSVAITMTKRMRLPIRRFLKISSDLQINGIRSNMGMLRYPV